MAATLAAESGIMSDLGWQLRGFLNLLGLDPRDYRSKLPAQIELGEAGIDPRTGGAVAVNIKATTDGKDSIRHLKTYYWRMLPNGQQESQKLFDIEFEPSTAMVPGPDGREVAVPMMIPRSVRVLGRPVPCSTQDDNEWDETYHTADARQRNLSRILQAAGDVNRQLRNGKLPNVAKILADLNTHEILGETLTVTGQSARGDGFDFDMPIFQHESLDSLTVPDAVGRALTGFGVNNLDRHQKLTPKPRRTVDSKTGDDFLISVKPQEGSNPKVWTGIEKLSGPHSEQTLPTLTSFKWKDIGDGLLRLVSQKLLGENMKDAPWQRQMQALGVTNRLLHDARSGNYGHTIDHLVEYDLYDMVQDFTPPPPLSKGGRLTVISAGGNNMEEIAGFANQIGGNSKVVYHEGLNAKGNRDRVGVIIDVGLHLSSKDDPTKWAAPDILQHLKDCNDILITHRHLDHTDGLFCYMQYGYLRGKTIHATPEVIRSIRDKLSTMPTIHKDDWPHFAELKGQGWLHIKDKKGDTRLSVNYARNATPHSARTTPFIVHGHYKGKWLGSYLNHGDGRFGRHNGDDYDGPPVDGDHLNREFFTQSNPRFLQEMKRANKRYAKRFDPKIAERGPTYFNMDVTSVTKDGWASTEPEVEDNLHELAHWFRDKGMILAMISTNDNRFETALRVANRAHRDVTFYGSNLEKTATTMNVQGVNDLRYTTLDRNNNQYAMDEHFAQRLQKKIDGYSEKLNAATNAKERETILAKRERHEARMAAFQELRGIGHAKRRYLRRQELEAELEARFGRETTLGSIAAEAEDDEHQLGAIQVGRTSDTARAIMGMEAKDLEPGEDGRRLILLTGTQGTNAEVDAALSGIAEGRHPVLNGNAANSHTARPLIPENNVVVISQSAIPGNGKKQDDLARKLAAQGYTVVQAIDHGFKLYNLDAAHRRIITEGLRKLGKSELKEEGDALVVTGMPIHASGHGQKKDCEAWLNMVQADVTAAQHTDNVNAAEELYKLGVKHHRRVMREVVPNGVGISIKAGETAEKTTVTTVGQGVASIIKGETIRQQRKSHGGHMIAQQVVRPDSADGLRWDGLRASTPKNGFHARAFATVDAEALARAQASRTVGRPMPVEQNRSAPVDYRPHEGIRYPGQELRGALFGRPRADDSAAIRKR